jgi:anti-sigma B factor antagonist
MEIGSHDAAEPEPGRRDPGHPAGQPGPNDPGGFAIAIRDEPTGTVVAVTGELDLLSAPQLRTALEALLPANARHIAIDLTDTTFMDSAGVHAVLDASHRAAGHLAVICAKGPVRQVIELLGLTEVLNVVSTLDEYRARRAGA